MQPTHRLYSVFAGVAIVGVAGLLCWPKSNEKVIKADTVVAGELLIVSPDGRRMIRLSVNNSTANIACQRTDGSQMVLISSSDLGDQIQLGGLGGEHAVMRLTNVNEPRLGAKPGGSIKFVDPHGNVERTIMAD